jgi:plastocyanin
MTIHNRSIHMRIHLRGAQFLLAPLVTLALAACGGDSPTAPVDQPQPPVPAATVQATPSEQFTPGLVTLVAGGTVTFAFGSLEHNVFFDNQPAGAPANITAPSANKSVTLTFDTKGTYVYNCHIHPGMKGTVVVE